jgi:hypothetical protein
MGMAILWLVCVALAGPSAGAGEQRISFSGEVSQGQTFRQSIGHGLDFVLMPVSMAGGITGWTIEVAPQKPPPDPQCNDYVWVVTPPYRFQNARYLDTSYGTIAQEAVRASRRQFSFVLNCADSKAERGRLDVVLWPYSYSQQQVDEARAKLGSSPLGKGRLWIEKYRITPGRRSTAEVELGVIHWIKFKVQIEFPPSVAQPAKP